MENKKLLIIEDEPSLLKALVEAFKSEEGIDVVTARDGVKGLDIALREHPDLIFLDIVMPNMGGVEMLRKLRDDDWGKDANVIVLSNLSSEKAISQSLREGVEEYLIKTDWHLSDLVTMVKNKLGV